MTLELPRLSLEPIGVVRSPFVERRDAPRQATLAQTARGQIELRPNAGFEEALRDIASWSHLWVVFWFHLNHEWQPLVQPPRGRSRRGVFATRSPYRPNPIGLSVVKLEGVRGLTLDVSSLDILDGSPVLDLKPYVPYSDALPDASDGWLASSTAEAYEVWFSADAEQRLGFLGQLGDELRCSVQQTLCQGPQQPKYRRIQRQGAGYRLAIKDWRVFFTVSAHIVEVTTLQSGYRTAAHEDALDVPEVHRAFVHRFPLTSEQ